MHWNEVPELSLWLLSTSVRPKLCERERHGLWLVAKCQSAYFRERDSGLGLWLLSTSALISVRDVQVKAINPQLAEFKEKETHAKKQHRIRHSSTPCLVVSSKLLMHSSWLLKKGQITPASTAID